MAKSKNPQKSAKNLLDRFSTERGRGRPPKVVRSAVVGRADNYRGILPMIWKELEVPLLKAQTEEEVVKAFQVAQPGGNEFPSLAPVILKAIKDAEFSTRRKAKINFLADSIAGVGLVTLRRSRTSGRGKGSKRGTKTSSLHHSIRVLHRVFLRLQGTFQNHACPKCGAEILFPVSLGSDIF